MDRPKLVELSVSIVAAYVSRNNVALKEIPALLKLVHSAVSDLSVEKHKSEASPPPSPAVPVRRSVTPDYLICLEDGKKMKMLKRHLRTTYMMSPDEYRSRWGLPADYPMVAPNYAAKRSQLARQFGLGSVHRGRQDRGMA